MAGLEVGLEAVALFRGPCRACGAGEVVLEAVGGGGEEVVAVAGDGVDVWLGGEVEDFDQEVGTGSWVGEEDVVRGVRGWGHGLAGSLSCGVVREVVEMDLRGWLVKPQLIRTTEMPL